MLPVRIMRSTSSLLVDPFSFWSTIDGSRVERNVHAMDTLALG
jgi:hypothetical protein